MLTSAAITFVEHAMKTDSYDSDRIREGLAVAGSRFMRDTRCVQISAEQELTAATAEQTLAIEGFRRERFCFGHISDEYIDVSEIGRSAMLRLLRTRSASGIPKRICWLTDSDVLVWPTPSQAYTLSVTYSEAFVDVSSGDPELNIPDEYLHEVLLFGATAATEHGDPDLHPRNSDWQRFLELIDNVKRHLTPTGVIDTYPEETL